MRDMRRFFVFVLFWFTIILTSNAFSDPTVTSIENSTVGNAGSSTFLFHGEGFDTDIDFVLRDREGNQRESIELIVSEDDTVFVTFDLIYAATGEADLLIQNNGVLSSTVEGAFDIILGGTPEVWAQCELLSEEEPDGWIPYELQFGNSGLVDAAAPMFELFFENAEGVKVFEDGGDEGIRFNLLGMDPDFPSDILRPGQTVSIPLWVKPGETTVEPRITIQNVSAETFYWEEEFDDDESDSSTGESLFEEMYEFWVRMGIDDRLYYVGDRWIHIEEFTEITPRPTFEISDNGSGQYASSVKRISPQLSTYSTTKDGKVNLFVLTVMNSSYNKLNEDIQADKYPSLPKGYFFTLPGVVSDHYNLNAFFQKRVPSSRIYTLFDTSATDDDITPEKFRETVDRIAQCMDGDDRLVVWYSGHGLKVQSTSMMLFNGGILYAQELNEILVNVPGKKIVVLDCCYSGHIIKSLQDPQISSLAACDENEEASDGNTRGIKVTVVKTQKSALQTASKEMSPTSSTIKGGAFTSSMLEYLQKHNNLFFREAFEYAHDKVQIYQSPVSVNFSALDEEIEVDSVVYDINTAEENYDSFHLSYYDPNLVVIEFSRQEGYTDGNTEYEIFRNDKSIFVQRGGSSFWRGTERNRRGCYRLYDDTSHIHESEPITYRYLATEYKEDGSTSILEDGTRSIETIDLSSEYDLDNFPAKTIEPQGMSRISRHTVTRLTSGTIDFSHKWNVNTNYSGYVTIEDTLYVDQGAYCIGSKIDLCRGAIMRLAGGSAFYETELSPGERYIDSSTTVYGFGSLRVDSNVLMKQCEIDTHVSSNDDSIRYSSFYANSDSLVTRGMKSITNGDVSSSTESSTTNTLEAQWYDCDLYLHNCKARMKGGRFINSSINLETEDEQSSDDQPEEITRGMAGISTNLKTHFVGTLFENTSFSASNVILGIEGCGFEEGSLSLQDADPHLLTGQMHEGTMSVDEFDFGGEFRLSKSELDVETLHIPSGSSIDRCRIKCSRFDQSSLQNVIFDGQPIKGDEHDFVCELLVGQRENLTVSNCTFDNTRLYLNNVESTITQNKFINDFSYNNSSLFIRGEQNSTIKNNEFILERWPGITLEDYNLGDSSAIVSDNQFVYASFSEENENPSPSKSAAIFFNLISRIVFSNNSITNLHSGVKVLGGESIVINENPISLNGRPGSTAIEIRGVTTKEASIQDNTLSCCAYGVIVESPDGYPVQAVDIRRNQIDCTPEEESRYGVLFENVEDSVIVENSILMDSSASNTVAISAVNARNVQIGGNSILCTSLRGSGVTLENAEETLVTANTIKTAEYGIQLNQLGSEVIVSENHLLGNSTGLYASLDASSSALIYNNEFSNASNGGLNAITENDTVSWNLDSLVLGENCVGGNYLGGNYWDDYSGEDFDGDGIGDTPHEHAYGIFDLYPLIKQNDDTAVKNFYLY
jgi:nitrous oxidase accessory protein NosD